MLLHLEKCRSAPNMHDLHSKTSCFFALNHLKRLNTESACCTAGGTGLNKEHALIQYPDSDYYFEKGQ